MELESTWLWTRLSGKEELTNDDTIEQKEMKLEYDAEWCSSSIKRLYVIKYAYESRYTIPRACLGQGEASKPSRTKVPTSNI